MCRTLKSADGSAAHQINKLLKIKQYDKIIKIIIMNKPEKKKKRQEMHLTIEHIYMYLIAYINVLFTYDFKNRSDQSAAHQT